MATTGDKINISTDDVMSAISILDSSLNVIDSSMLQSISKDFGVLASLNLFSEGLEKLKKQLESLKQSNENLMTKITLHADEISELEDAIATQIQKELVAGDAGSGGGGNYYSDIAAIEVANVTNNTNISNTQVLENINGVTELDIESILSFLNINKGEYSINDILLTDVGSGILLCLLKKFYGDNNVNIDTNVSEETLNIQKVLLEKLLSSENGIESVEFKDNTIIIAKEYFNSIAKENNLTISELLLDEKNETLLLSSINKLYLGKDLTKYNVKEETIKSVKEFVNKIAEDNGVTSEEVLSNTDYLGDLKGV